MPDNAWLLLAAPLSGCVTGDGIRQRQSLSIMVNGEQSGQYRLFLVRDQAKSGFNCTNSVHFIELPEQRYSAGLVGLIPFNGHPEKREKVLFTKENKKVQELAVRKIRQAEQTSTGAYLIRLNR